MTNEIAVNGRTIVAFVLAAGLSACVQATPPPTPTIAPVACATPSPSVTDPLGVTGPGAHLGPLLIVGFGTAVAPTPAPIGSPTKVLIHPLEQFDGSIILTGSRCSDGQPLRFWYRGGTPFSLGPGSTPIPEAVLAQTGDLSVDVRYGGGNAGTTAPGSDYAGYMLFTTTGAWRVRGQSGGRAIGEVIIVVSVR
jgi:hypothetical protein